MPSYGAGVLLMKTKLFTVAAVCLATAATAGVVHHNAARRESIARKGDDAAARLRALEAYGKIPLSFEANSGQTDERVKFLERKATRDARRAQQLEFEVTETGKEAAAQRKEQWAYLAANWSTEMPADVAVLIVDGNNMRGGGPQRLSRTAVTTHVTQAVQACAKLHSAELICFFDHALAEHGPAQGMRVIYSGDTIADDKIVELVASFGPDRARQTCVVTCDRGLALRLLALGARVARNSTFNALNPAAPKAYGRSH